MSEKNGLLPTPKYDQKKTNTSIFMLPSLEISPDDLSKHGFINAYMGDSMREESYENCLYLLFRPKDLVSFEDFLENRTDIVEDYDVGEGTVIVIFKIPEQYHKDYKNFRLGKYSKFSKTYVKRYFPFSKKVMIDGKLKEENTLFYHIFTKSDWIKEWWNKRLGYDEDHELVMDEWWDIPNEEIEVFRYKKDKEDGE